MCRLPGLYQWICWNLDSWYAWNMFPALPHHWHSDCILCGSCLHLDWTQLAVSCSSNFEFGWIILFTREPNLVIEKRTCFFYHFFFICVIFIIFTIAFIAFLLRFYWIFGRFSTFIRAASQRQQAQLSGSGVDTAMQITLFKRSKMNWKQPEAFQVRCVICLRWQPIAKVSWFASVWCSSNNFRVSMLWSSFRCQSSNQLAATWIPICAQSLSVLYKCWWHSLQLLSLNAPVAKSSWSWAVRWCACVCLC